jgi:hypothetical protein
MGHVISCDCDTCHSLWAAKSLRILKHAIAAQRDMDTAYSSRRIAQREIELQEDIRAHRELARNSEGAEILRHAIEHVVNLTRYSKIRTDGALIILRDALARVKAVR